MAISPIIRRPLEALGFLAPAEVGGMSPAPIRQASPQETEAAPALDRMISRSADSSWFPSAWLDAIETNDDPILSRDGSGLKLFDALLSDETAMSTLQQRRLAITSKEWEVVPGDENDPRAVKAADDFRAMVDALGFDRVTGLLHYGIWYGYAVAEGLFTIKEHDGRLIVWLDDVVIPDRGWFGFTKQGELRYIGANSGLSGEALPPNKFLTIRTGGTHDFAFYGMGLAHWCYWPIFFKRSALKFWALYLEKLGQPTVAIGFPAADKDDKKKLASLLSTAQAIGKDSAVLVPEAYLAEEKVKIFESQRSGNNVSGYKDFVAENNEAIMRVVLGQPGTSKGVSSGLNSNQASEHAGVKEEIVKADSDLITDAFGSTFGAWITRWNHGEDVKPPIVRRILKAGEDLNAVAERDSNLDAIGIRRSEDSVKATYGDGYEVDRVSAAEQAATDNRLALAKAKVGTPAITDPDAEKDPARIAFTADDEAAIERLIAASVSKASPLFEAIGNAMRDSLQGVTTVEGARVAILSAVEQFDPTDLAKALALPLLAERAAASVGADDEVDA